MLQVAHDDGVAGLVQERCLLAYAHVVRLALQFGSGAGREDLQCGVNEMRSPQRLAVHHQDHAQGVPSLPVSCRPT